MFTGRLGTDDSQLGQLQLGEVGEQVVTPVAIEAALVGDSTFAGALEAVFALEADLFGDGSLASTAQTAFSVEAVLTGGAVASPALNASWDLAAALSGDTSFAGDLSNLVLVDVTMVGQSTITATVFRQFKPILVLSGGAALSGAANLVLRPVANLVGGSTSAPDLGIHALISASLAGDSTSDFSLLGESDFVPTTLTGGATLTADLTAVFAFEATLAADSSVSSDAVVAWAVEALVTGGTTSTADLTALFSLESSLTADASIVSNLADNISATLQGDSTFTPTEFVRVRYLTATVQGQSFATSTLDWKGHPAPLPPAPRKNAAVTLREFIDALGVERAATRTPVRGDLIVLVDPPRRILDPGERS